MGKLAYYNIMVVIYLMSNDFMITHSYETEYRMYT